MTRTGPPQALRIGLLLAPALLVVGVFFVGGVGQGVLQSLGRQPFLPGSDTSLDAYRRVLDDPAFWPAVRLTLRVTVIATAVSTVLGVAIALLVRRVATGPMTALLQAGLAVPHLVAALAIGLLLGTSGLLSRVSDGIGLTGGAADFPVLTGDAFGWGIIASYVWKETPFIALVALAAMSGRVTALEDAARTLGADARQRFRSVTLPLIAPPVAAASVLVLAFTTASYEVPRLLGQPFPATLPVVAFERFRDPDLTARPEAMAIATMLAVFTIVLAGAYLALVSRLARRSL